MPVNITTKAPKYFVQKDERGRQPLISKIELASLANNNPKYLGKVMAEHIDQTSILAELMMKGNEFEISASQVFWQEEEDVTAYGAAAVVGKGAVTRSGSTFTITNNAISEDPYDIDSSRPTEPLWLQVKEGMNFMAVDDKGKVNHGIVTKVAEDKKSFTASLVGDVTTFVIGEENIDIFFLGYNLDHCETAPCVGWKSYAPKYENSFKKDSVCMEYCEETEAENGMDGGDAFPVFKGLPDGDVSLDSRLDDKIKFLTQTTDLAFAFSKRLTEQQANGKPRGTNGVLPILEARATKNEGMLETMDDLKKLAGQLRSMGIKKATLRCTNEQYTKIVDITTNPTNAQISINPFENKESLFMSIGYSGFKIGDVEILFKQWTALDMIGSNLPMRYHYVVIPELRLRRLINGKMQECGAINIAWFKGMNENYKMLRREDNKTEGYKKVNYINKFAPIVFMPHKFILGITA